MADKPSGEVINWDDYSIHPSMYAPERPEKRSRKRERLPLSDEPFTRVFHSWLANHRLFPPHIRLLIVLVLLSREGREPVRLTAEVAGEAGIPNRDKSRYARDLERLGAVHVWREGQRALVLTVLLVAPK
jgi:hypothetical protein